MAGDIIVQALVEGIAEVVTHVAVHGVRAAREKKRERVLAAADLLVLAAHHDHRVTRGERQEVAARCTELLGTADVEVDVPALLVRWEDERAALTSDEAFEAKVREIAEVLESKDKASVLTAVEAVLRAERDPEATVEMEIDELEEDGLAVFRRVLGD